MGEICDDSAVWDVSAVCDVSPVCDVGAVWVPAIADNIAQRVPQITLERVPGIAFQ